ncbi:MAG: acyltransferase family protein [Acidobacteriota bacterium]
MSQLEYRPDVDGLRAVSVVLVVLYHAGGLVPGGYVGVDVFFVISGFLITSLIRSELETGRFSLVRFYERRVRRILPASLACAVGTIALGSVVMLPADFADLGDSAIAHALALANVFFLRQGGYFAGPSDVQPLLHSWSLAVEEQFYLFYPLLLMLVFRLRRASLTWVVSGLTVASFALSTWSVAAWPDATFYLLPFRAWELLIGGLLAIVSLPRLGRVARELGSVTGLALIVLAAVLFDASTTFPGPTALLPCLGAVLLIASHSGETEPTTIGRVLTLRPMVFVGLISYSLYLWHWPIMALMRYSLIELDLVASAVAILLSFVLAVLSWRFVEQPFRRSRSRETGSDEAAQRDRRRVFVAGALATLAVLALGAVLRFTGGLPQRLGPEATVLAEDATWHGADMEMTGTQVDHPRIGATESARDSFVVWGDSHAMMLSDVLDHVAREAGVSGRFIASSGVPPLPEVWRKDRGEPAPTSTRIVEELVAAGPRDVILIARWSVWTEGYGEGDLAYEVRGQRFDECIIGDEQTETHSPEDGRRVLNEHLRDLVATLQAAGKRTWIVQQVPEQQGPTAFPWFLQHRLGWTRELHPTTREKHEHRQGAVNTILTTAVSEGARLVETQDLFFDEESRPILIRDGRACYRDNDHLSKHGARALLGDRFAEMMRVIAAGSS